MKPKPLVLSSDNSPKVMVMVMAMEAILICALRWQDGRISVQCCVTEEAHSMFHHKIHLIPFQYSTAHRGEGCTTFCYCEEQVGGKFVSQKRHRRISERMNLIHPRISSSHLHQYSHDAILPTVAACTVTQDNTGIIVFEVAVYNTLSVNTSYLSWTKKLLSLP